MCEQLCPKCKSELTEAVGIPDLLFCATCQTMVEREEKEEPLELKFRQCARCEGRPRGQDLCPACGHNKEVIEYLTA